MKNVLHILFFQLLTKTVLFFILISDTALAQEKDIAALKPIGEIHKCTEIGKQIIFNNLQEIIPTQYSSVSQKTFETALSKTSEKLNHDGCSKYWYFKLIQQIYLNRVSFSTQLPVYIAFCEECSLGEFSTKVDGLGMELIAKNQIPTAVNKTIPKPKLAKKSVKILDPEVQSEESPSSRKTWHYVAVSLTVLSALMSYNAANSYNELSKKNNTLATQYSNSSSSSEKASLKSEYDSNATKMKSNKNSIQAWDFLTLIGLGLEAYLIMTDDFAHIAPNSRKSFSQYAPLIAIQAAPSGLQTFLQWNLRF